MYSLLKKYVVSGLNGESKFLKNQRRSWWFERKERWELTLGYIFYKPPWYDYDDMAACDNFTN